LSAPTDPQRPARELGRVVSHPRAIEVTATQGRVTLSGLILACEIGPLLASVHHVRGVTGVENRLDAHERPDDIPTLQGGTPRTGEAWEFLQTSWSPTARLLAGLAGGALALYGMRRRGNASLTDGPRGGIRQIVAASLRTTTLPGDAGAADGGTTARACPAPLGRVALMPMP
jgi:hypothetical protein